MTEEAGQAAGPIDIAQQGSASAQLSTKPQEDPQNDGHTQGGAAMNTAGQGSQDDAPPPSDPPPVAETQAPYRRAPELGDAVFLFERNHHPETSEVLDGYQDPKVGTLVGLDEDTGRADIKVGGEDSAPVTSHNVPYKSMSIEGENYWSERAD